MEVTCVLRKQGTDNWLELKKRINEKLSRRNIKRQASDLAPLLPDRRETMKVELFPKILMNWAEK